MPTWNWLDWVLAAVVFASIVAAMLRGFIRELISLAGVLVGLVVAALGYARMAVWYEDFARAHEVALGLGFLTLFLATLAVAALVSVLARKLIKTAGLEWFDRFLGGIFGLVRGAMIDCVVLMAMVAFTIKPEAVERSALAPYVTAGARVVALVMPGDLREHFRVGFEKFRQTLIRRDKGTTKN